MKFDAWFEEQFGAEPFPEISLITLYGELDTLKSQLFKAEEKIKKREQWLDRRNAVSYAWQIKDKEKK